MTRAKTDVRDALPLFADDRYDLYTTIRSKTPERQRFYDWLEAHGWRWDERRCEWHAPESEVREWTVRGRFCSNMDNTAGWIQPPCFDPERGKTPDNPLPGPILHLRVREDGTVEEAS